jgi:acylphosphatase
VEWSKIGPENAKVNDVTVDFKEYTGKYGDFLIQHDEA